MLWETFMQQRPGTRVQLVFRDGSILAGRLLAAGADGVEVVDTSRPAARPAAPEDAALVRLATRDEVAAAYVLRDRSLVGRALKLVTLAAGIYFLVGLVAFVALGAPST